MADKRWWIVQGRGKGADGVMFDNARAILDKKPTAKELRAFQWTIFGSKTGYAGEDKAARIAYTDGWRKQLPKGHPQGMANPPSSRTPTRNILPDADAKGRDLGNKMAGPELGVSPKKDIVADADAVIKKAKARPRRKTKLKNLYIDESNISPPQSNRPIVGEPKASPVGEPTWGGEPVDKSRVDIPSRKGQVPTHLSELALGSGSSARPAGTKHVSEAFEKRYLRLLRGLKTGLSTSMGLIGTTWAMHDLMAPIMGMPDPQTRDIDGAFSNAWQTISKSLTSAFPEKDRDKIKKKFVQPVPKIYDGDSIKILMDRLHSYAKHANGATEHLKLPIPPGNMAINAIAEVRSRGEKSQRIAREEKAHSDVLAEETSQPRKEGSWQVNMPREEAQKIESAERKAKGEERRRERGSSLLAARDKVDAKKNRHFADTTTEGDPLPEDDKKGATARDPFRRVGTGSPSAGIPKAKREKRARARRTTAETLASGEGPRPSSQKNSSGYPGRNIKSPYSARLKGTTTEGDPLPEDTTERTTGTRFRDRKEDQDLDRRGTSTGYTAPQTSVRDHPGSGRIATPRPSKVDDSEFTKGTPHIGLKPKRSRMETDFHAQNVVAESKARDKRRADNAQSVKEANAVLAAENAAIDKRNKPSTTEPPKMRGRTKTQSSSGTPPGFVTGKKEAFMKREDAKDLSRGAKLEPLVTLGGELKPPAPPSKKVKPGMNIAQVMAGVDKKDKQKNVPASRLKQDMDKSKRVRKSDVLRKKDYVESGKPWLGAKSEDEAEWERMNRESEQYARKGGEIKKKKATKAPAKKEYSTSHRARPKNPTINKTSYNY